MSSLLERAKSIADGARVIFDWLGHGGVCVSQEQAQTRADVCANCPENKPSDMLTKDVADAIRKHLEVKNRLQLRVNGEKSLQQCGVCLCNLRLKCWVPIDVIRKHMNDGELERFPEHCWQKTEP